MIHEISNIDTIYILVDIEDYEKSSSEILCFLHKEKEKAMLEATSNANSKHLITINEMPFQILSNGSKGYAYILHNNGYEVKVAQYKSSIQSFAPIQVRISSEYLWSKGLINSWKFIYDWLENTFGKVKENKVSRIDLAMHTSDVDFITRYEETYKGTFKKRCAYYTGNTISSITFGTRKGKNIYCRIYNKTLELKETKKKPWFIEIWDNNGLNIHDVWNLEFELKSEFLREFKILTVQDVENKLKDIWQYCTKNWLIKIDRTNTRVERCKTNDKWIEIQHAYDNFHSEGMIKREKQIDMEADVLIPSIVGNITSYSARKKITDVNVAFSTLLQGTRKYLVAKETNFEKEVQNKMLFLKESGGE